MRDYLPILSFILAASFGLFACGGPVESEDQFKPYLEDFKADAKLHNQNVDGIQVSLRKDNLTSKAENLKIPSQCGIEDGTATVRIDSNAWNKASEEERQLVMYHQLAHCLLGRQHENAKAVTFNGVSSSIMIPDSTSISDFSARKKEYLDELFSKGQPGGLMK